MNSQRVRFVVATTVLVELLLVSLLAWALAREHSERREEESGMAFNRRPDAWWRSQEAQPVTTPPVIPSDRASIGPDEVVAGVVVNGKARAYRLESMRLSDRHLINDLIGKVPVSISYCNLSNCVRVYMDTKSSEPLDIQVAGILNGDMILKIKGSLYSQKSGTAVETGEGHAKVPYATLTPERTTWRQWRMDHPETDLYVGEGSGRMTTR